VSDVICGVVSGLFGPSLDGCILLKLLWKLG